MDRPAFYYSDRFLQYNLGPNHPLQPSRLRNTYELLASYGAFGADSVREPKDCPAEALEAIHSTDFLQAVQALSEGKRVKDPHRYGFGSGDNPVFPGMWEASLLYTGASWMAADDVATCRSPIAFNISGGLHHAHHGRAAGFCTLNDCAVAINRLRQTYARVAYVDIDVHHGDGVQELFYSDPTVLTISIHETGQTLFPGTGYVYDRGTGAGVGYSVNIPVWPYSTDEVWLRAWTECSLPLLRAFKPEAICLQLGTDAHWLDPLARVCLTTKGWLCAVEDVANLGVPIVALGGGGYNPSTVPRMWTLAYAMLAGASLPNDTPAHFALRTQMPTLHDTDAPQTHKSDLETANRFADDTIESVKDTFFAIHGVR